MYKKEIRSFIKSRGQMNEEIKELLRKVSFNHIRNRTLRIDEEYNNVQSTIHISFNTEWLINNNVLGCYKNPTETYLGNSS